MILKFLNLLENKTGVSNKGRLAKRDWPLVG